MSKLNTIAAGALALLLCAQASFTADAKAPKEVLFGDRPTSVKHPDWMKDAVIYEVNLRQGTPERNLKGMQLQLPRLKDLGVDILWLMPIHPISEKNRKGTKGSYYAVADYKAVNPEFGTMDDLREFVRTAHNLGMKVIIDEVCNHTGGDNVWLTSNPDFYVRDAKGNLVSPYDWTDTYKLDYSNPKMREAMYDALTYWVKEADIDGYRFDVAGEVPTDFWDGLRPRLDAIKPVFMLAESSKPELTLNAFDADYNWPMKDVFNAVAATGGANQWAVKKNQKLRKLTAKDIPALVETQKKQYPRGATSMNMITNHDLNSWEGTEFDRLGPATGAFAVLSYTLPGMPMLYTGQEVGFNHPFEFFELDTIQPDYTANQFTLFYKMLNALKHANPALDASADAAFNVIDAGQPDLLAFERANGDSRVIVLANLSGAEQKPAFAAAPAIGGMINYFTGAKAAIPTSLKPWEYVVLTTPLK